MEKLFEMINDACVSTRALAQTSSLRNFKLLPELHGVFHSLIPMNT